MFNNKNFTYILNCAINGNEILSKKNMNLDELQREIKELIVSSLDLEDVDAKGIKTDAPLFVEGLGLDSIDALELGIALRRKYNISLDKNSEENKKYFYSVKTLAEFIITQKKQTHK